MRVPEGVDGKVVQTRMLTEFGIEIGGGLGANDFVGVFGIDLAPHARAARA